MNKSELLTPVGNLEMCKAAIHNGTDAIYVGTPNFNARGRSKDFSEAELKEIINLCHLYKVKVFIAFNVLIFEKELEIVIKTLKKIIKLSPDAIIVQDLSLVKIINKIAPSQVVHASTQMTTTSSQAIKFLDDLDIKRFVLGRENSISDIKKIKDETDKEIEVFVHGALCVAYSGQCFTSEGIGGRSANRGQCAQSCRFSYDMYVDGKKHDLVDQKYLVSPQDLCGIEEIPKLKEIGVDSFKIEGRLKTPEYAAYVTSLYKQKMNDTSKVITQKEYQNLGVTFSRGFFPGWLNGVDHQNLVPATFSSHRGVEIGKIERIDRKHVLIRTSYFIKNGLGLLFVTKDGIETGDFVYSSTKNSSDLFKVSLSKEFSLKKLKIGSTVYINSDPTLKSEITKTYTDKDKQKRMPLNITLKAFVGKKLKVICSFFGEKFVVESEDILEIAKKSYDLGSIKKGFDSFTNSPFFLQEFKLEINKNNLPFIHSKALKKLRQNLVKQLTEDKQKSIEKNLNEYKLIGPSEPNFPSPKFTILLRELYQVNELISLINFQKINKDLLSLVHLDFEFGANYSPAIQLLKENNVQVSIATTRILKPGENHHLKHIIRLNPDYILVRNLGAFQFLKEHAPHIKLKGDFSLNISNSISMDYLIKKGLETITPSYDLNLEQMSDLVSNSIDKKFEINIHQYMPSFHMEHCVFAAFLSDGKSFKDCGKPCEKHSVTLEDQFKNTHFIKADQECRNTMYNGTAQSSIQLYEDFSKKGWISEKGDPNSTLELRIELLNESNNLLQKKLTSYFRYLENKLSLSELNKQLNLSEKYGLGAGNFFKSDTYTSRKN